MQVKLVVLSGRDLMCFINRGQINIVSMGHFLGYQTNCTKLVFPLETHHCCFLFENLQYLLMERENKAAIIFLNYNEWIIFFTGLLNYFPLN